MRIVSKQSEEEIRKRRTAEALAPVMRQLTANLLRIVRGSGSPKYIRHQLENCIRAIEAYEKAHKSAPDALFRRALDCDAAQVEFRPWIKKLKKTNRDEALKSIRRGSLQIAASMLVDTYAQQTAGESEVYKGIDRIYSDLDKQTKRQKSGSIEL